jgi:hypothetical protein
MRGGCLLWILLLLILSSPFILWLVWSLEPPRPVALVMLDQTVPDLNMNSHSSYYWILEEEHYVRPDRKYFQKEQDYYGFFPIDQRNYMNRTLTGTTDIDSLAAKIKGLVMLDGYGVRHDRWLKGRLSDEQSEFLSGGLDESEFELLESMKNAQKPIVFESRVFSPRMTPDDVYRLESVAGVKWTGWWGYSFESLDPNENPRLPTQWIQAWEDQNHRNWRFKGAGVLLVGEGGDVVALTMGVHLKQANPILRTEFSDQLDYRVPPRVPFTGSFEIVSPVSPDYHTVSRFDLNLTVAGDSLLAQYHIPRTFPAVLTAPRMTFIAGDFSGVGVTPSISHLYRMERVMQPLLRFTEKKQPQAPDRFFWEYYYPVMKKVLGRIYSPITTAGN